MEERYNPMESARSPPSTITICWTVFSQIRPHPDVKRSWIRLREPPHKCRSRERERTMTKKRRRPIHLHVMVSEEQQALFNSAWPRRASAIWGLYAEMASMAMCSMLTSRPSGSWYHPAAVLQQLNQVAIQANTYGWDLPRGDRRLQRDLAALWGPLSDSLKKLAHWWSSGASGDGVPLPGFTTSGQFVPECAEAGASLLSSGQSIIIM